MNELGKFVIPSVDGDSSKKEQKGSINNPYTIDEYEQLHDQNLWESGYVEGVGLVADTNTDSSRDSYQYSSFDFDINNLPPDHYQCSTDAVRNHADCSYQCIGSLMGVDSLTIPDLYFAWLKARAVRDGSTLNETDIKGLENRVAYGATETDLLHFTRAVASKFNYKVETMTKNRFLEKCSTGKELNGYGIVHDSDGNGHAIIIKGINENLLDFYDPQNPNGSTMYSISQLKCYFEFHK